MATSRQIHEALGFSIRPSTFPVGVLPLPEISAGPRELIDKAKLPLRDLKHTITVCVSVGMARRYGWTEATQKAGQRYPIPTFMRFSPDMPPAYKKLMEYLHQEGDAAPGA